MKKKIIFVPRRFVREKWGGTETVILETAKRLRDEGYKPEIWTSLALSGKSEEEYGGIRVKRYEDFYPYAGLSASERELLDDRGGNMVSFRLFFAILFSRNIELIHLCTMGRLGAMVRTAAKIRNIPYIVTIHGGYFNVPASEKEDLLTPTAGKLDWGKIFGFVFGARKVLRDAAAITCVNKAEQEMVRREFPGKKVVWIPNGVDPEKLRKGDERAFRLKYNMGNDRIVLCVSRIDPQKDQMLLLSVFKKLAESNGSLRLVLIGNVTNAPYFKSVNERINEDSVLKGRVLVLTKIGFCDEDLINAYAAAEVFVLPSRHEPFGIVVLEAWAAGKPVVVSDAAGIKDIASDGENALFFENGSEKSLENALLRMLEDRDLARSIGEHGDRTARRYDWKHLTEQFIGLYEELA